MPVSYQLRRVILFTHSIAEMRDFYRDVIGLTVVEEDAGWVDLAGGGCNIALHAAGPHVPESYGEASPHKLVFNAGDVAAARVDLISRGAKMGAVKAFGDMHLCDGADPDGNRIPLSNRA